MNKFLPLLVVFFLQAPMTTVLAQDKIGVTEELINTESVETVVEEEVKKEVQEEVDKKFQDNVVLTRDIPTTTAVILGTAILVSSLLLGLTIYKPLANLGQQKYDHNNVPLTTMDDRTEFVETVLPKVIEGITVYLIVAVVSILSLSGTIQPQGTITILASISGYVLSKQNQKNTNSGMANKLSYPVNREKNVAETRKESSSTSNEKKVEPEKKPKVDFSKIN